MIAQNKIRIQHIRRIKADGNVDTKGGLTVAYLYEFNRYNKPDSTVLVATALCNIRDSYNKKEGKRRAMDNFAAGQTIRLPVRGRDIQSVMAALQYLCGEAEAADGCAGCEGCHCGDHDAGDFDATIKMALSANSVLSVDAAEDHGTFVLTTDGSTKAAGSVSGT